MDKIYLLEDLASDTDVFINDYKASDPIEQNYFDGAHIPAQKPIKLYYEKKVQQKTDLLSGVHSFPVISERFRQLLIKTGITNIEFHPAWLICTETNQIDRSYWFLNILNNVSGLDWERSTYRLFPGTKNVILELFKLAIKQEEFEGRDLSRLSEVRTLILSSERLRKRIEAAKLCGIDFRRLSDYTSPLEML